MSSVIRSSIVVLLCGSFGASVVSAKDAILPQGDPRLQGPDTAEQARRDETRRNRLKQQGQGDNYRIEGELQGGTSPSTLEKSTNDRRQDTGLADPTVNPGQASGMNGVRGRIIRSEGKTHTIRQSTGEDTVLFVDDYTSGDTDLRPGDFITGTLTRQGRAVVVQKEMQSEPE